MRVGPPCPGRNCINWGYTTCPAFSTISISHSGQPCLRPWPCLIGWTSALATSMRLIEPARPARWGRSDLVARDPPKRRHTRAKVGGPCPVSASSARSPKRVEATTNYNARDPSRPDVVRAYSRLLRSAHEAHLPVSSTAPAYLAPPLPKGKGQSGRDSQLPHDWTFIRAMWR